MTYCIAAIHRFKTAIVDGQRIPLRYLIKVSSLATREGLLKEIRLMNTRREASRFRYILTTEPQGGI